MLKDIGIKAQKAAQQLKKLDSDLKNKIIYDMSHQLLEDKDLILNANNQDLKNAQDMDLSSALIDRLTPTKEQITSMGCSYAKLRFR